MGMWTSRRWRRAGSASSSASRGVSIGPGQIELARIPWRAYSTASSRVKEYPAFGGGVGDLGGGRPHQGHERGHVDDGATAGGQHGGHRGPAAEPHPLAG